VVVAGAAKHLAQHVSATDVQVAATLPRDDSDAERTDPRRNQALILSEQAAFRHNTGRGTTRLSLFYPTDGAPLLDYPYTLVDEDHLDLDASRAALRFQQLLGDAEGRRALVRLGFRDRQAHPSPTVVRAAGGSAPQPATAIRSKPPTREEVRSALALWTITVQSARLITVVDASASMEAPVPGHGGQSRMELTRASLVQGLTTFTADDEVGLWRFATRLDGDVDHEELLPARRLGEPTPDGTTQREALLDAFQRLAPVPDGATGLYDTTLAAYRAAQDAYSYGKFNAVVVLTDGANDDPDSLTRDELVARLRALADPQRPVPVIALAIGPDADIEELLPIAAATGGVAQQVSDPAQIQPVVVKAITAVGRG
jgi:Mg-chelatase subunit ChlD